MTFCLIIFINMILVLNKKIYKCIEKLKNVVREEVFIVIQNAIILYFILLVFKDFFIHHKIIIHGYFKYYSGNSFSRQIQRLGFKFQYNIPYSLH